jgi:hypothetical protein
MRSAPAKSRPRRRGSRPTAASGARWSGASRSWDAPADTTHRARRRHAEQQAAGTAAELEAVERDLRERDHADRSRADSPLVQAHDALYLDTTEQDADQVLAHMLAVVEERRASRQ